MEKEEIRRKILELGALYCESLNADKAEMKYIPASGKVLDVSELSNMLEASLDMWLTTGRFNEDFERKFSKFLGVMFTKTVNSGSSANLVALSTLTSPKLGDSSLKRGDEVITVAAGFPTTVNPIIQNGLIPVFVDNELSTYNIDASKIEEAITPRTRAVFAAHTLGNPFDIDAVLSVCKRHNLYLIEDSCDALGAEYKGRKVGTFGDLSTYSFYPAHHITMGEGGAVATNSAKLDRIAASFRDWGRDCWCPPGKDNTCKNRFKMKLGRLPDGYDHKYTYSHIGYNLKITDWQAAIGLAQLAKLPAFLSKRKENAEYLLESLKGLEDSLILPKTALGSSPSWFGFLISVREGAKFKKRELVEHLENSGIGTRQLFAGNILRQPMFTDGDIDFRIGNSSLMNSRDIDESVCSRLKNADFIMNHSFWIGCYPALGERELSKTAKTIRDFVERAK